MVSGKKNNGDKNRTRLDIYVDIISSANSGNKKTNIIDRANLSSGQFEEHSDFLIERRLLAIKNDGTFFATSDGYEYFFAY
jgi:predicted transcriptional regulator